MLGANLWLKRAREVQVYMLVLQQDPVQMSPYNLLMNKSLLSIRAPHQRKNSSANRKLIEMQERSLGQVKTTRCRHNLKTTKRCSVSTNFIHNQQRRWLSLLLREQVQSLWRPKRLRIDMVDTWACIGAQMKTLQWLSHQMHERRWAKVCSQSQVETTIVSLTRLANHFITIRLSLWYIIKPHNSSCLRAVSLNISSSNSPSNFPLRKAPRATLCPTMLKSRCQVLQQQLLQLVIAVQRSLNSIQPATTLSWLWYLWPKTRLLSNFSHRSRDIV